MSKPKVILTRKWPDEAEKKAKELLQSGDPTESEWKDEESRQKIYENKLRRSFVRQTVAKFQ